MLITLLYSPRYWFLISIWKKKKRTLSQILAALAGVLWNCFSILMLAERNVLCTSAALLHLSDVWASKLRLQEACRTHWPKLSLLEMLPCLTRDGWSVAAGNVPGFQSCSWICCLHEVSVTLSQAPLSSSAITETQNTFPSPILGITCAKSYEMH